MSGKFVCLLEGPSDVKMLRVLIPRLTDLDEDNIELISLGDKSRLLSRVKDKLDNHNGPKDVFLVMCDNDRGNCEKLKQELQGKVAKKIIKRTKVIIACQEMESFYLGDLRAVGRTLNLPDLHKKQDESCYGMPDNCKEKPSKLLKELTTYRYHKTASPSGIAKHLRLDGRNKSYSFKMLVNAIKELHKILQKNANP